MVASAVLLVAFCFFANVQGTKDVTEDKEDPLITINQGTLRGKEMKSTLGATFYGFMGIPYAKPPVGELRFKPSHPPGEWKGTLDATKEGDYCLQINMFFNEGTIVGSEDCLFLNVYTPELPSKTKQPKKSVMLWLHGGGFVSGSGGPFFYGPEMLMDYDIVLVTINYRLGALGFLSTGDEHATGNYGLTDQVQALRWVQKNIEAFGGNSESVTIFGESAGGASVHYMILSPMAKGLFHRAISQSGSALNPWALIPNPQRVAKKHAQHMGCPIDSSENLMACLRKRKAREITEAQKIHYEFRRDPLTQFSLCVDSEAAEPFLPDDPFKLMKAGAFSQVPYITGYNKDEGSFMASGYAGENKMTEIKDNYERLWPIMLFLKGRTTDPVDVARKIKKFYFGEEDISLEPFVKVLSDRHFAKGIDETIKIHSAVNKAPVFAFLLAHRTNWTITKMLDPSRNYGVSHADDLFFLFKTTVVPPLSEEDKRKADVVLKMWTDFAKTGNPTPEVLHDINTTWKPVNSKNPQHLRIDSTLRMEPLQWKDRMDFWDTLPILENKKYSHRDEF